MADMEKETDTETVQDEDMEVVDGEVEDTEETAEAEGTEAEGQDAEADEAEAEGGEAEEEGSEAEAKPEKKGFFKKKDKKDKKDEQIEALTDQLLRSRAEFDNYRKRTDKEKEAQFDLGAKNVVEKLLPVVDNFERGFASIPEDEKEAPFAVGMDKVHKQLVKMLDDLGVQPIEAVGKPFDPNFHNAVMQVPAEDGVEENTVVEEFQKGYIYKGYVVRYSMVKVAI